MRQNLMITLIIMISLFSCKPKQQEFTYPEKDAIVGLASPITLQPDETIVYLSDYFPESEKIDSVTTIKSLNLSLENNKNKLTINSGAENIPTFFTLEVWSKGFAYHIPVKKSKKTKYTFNFDSKGKTYKTVQLKGEFNAWNPANTNLKFKNNIWTTDLIIKPGKYQYKTVLDGKETMDFNNPDSVENGIGGYNSLLTIKGKVNNPVSIFTKSFTNKNITIAIEGKADTFFVFYENTLLPDNYYQYINNELTIKIPNTAQSQKRAFIRIWAANDTEYTNDILIPLNNGNVLYDVKSLERTDYEAATIYNVFVDRFYNGNKDNDRPLNSPEVHPRADYHGGDISGISQIINKGYFDSLGINTIWISPIVKNPEEAYGQYPTPKTKFSGYHGYWPISFTEIDNRFGNENEFKKLVSTVHENNMNILLDFVANHVHELHPVYQQNKNWATELYLPDGTLNTEKWDEHRLTTWFDTFLPTLNLEKPEVYEMLTDSALFWIKNYNLDGFRHDATKHIPEIFWRTLSLKIKKDVILDENRRIYQIGETYGTPELIGSYVNSGQLDAQFDFNVYDANAATFAKKDATFKRLVEELQKSFDSYGYHHLMGNITGNQDRGRFMSYAGGALRFDEDSKKAGWTREVGIGDSIAYNKMAQLIAMNTSIPGIPVIYYGDEIGFYGGNDPDNRKMMRFDDLSEKEAELKNISAKLLKLRRNNLALIYGDYKILHQTDKQLVIARIYFDKIAVSIFNISDKDVELSFSIPEYIDTQKLKNNFDNEFKFENQKISILLKANSFEIITN